MEGWSSARSRSDPFELVLGAVLEKNEPRLLGEPALSRLIGAGDLVVRRRDVVVVHDHTAFSAVSPSNFPRRDAPIV